jgi:membrane dipeptidase
VITACAHNDLLLELVGFRHEPEPFRARWLPQLEQGGVVLQVCPIYVDAVDLPELGLRRALEQVAAFRRAVRETSDRVVHVASRADLERVARGERIGLVLALEGAEPLGNDVELADVFWALGVRMVGLTWMRRNAFADGNAEPAHGGLSRLGGALVERLLDLGMILDLAHASDRTFADALERVEARGGGSVLVSHSACRALVDSPRNVSDEQLGRLGAADGLLGVMCHPFALGAGATLATVCEHVEHARAVAGPGGVGLGGDFTLQLARSGAVPAPRDVELPPGMGLEDPVAGLGGPEDYPQLAAELARRDHDEAQVAAVMGGNLLAFLGRALPGS